MADILRMAKQLISIAEYLRDQFGIYYGDGELCDFDQTWGSTALGFGGLGGSKMTTERTYVYFPNSQEDTGYVFFGNGFAYKVSRYNHALEEDLKKHCMASVVKSGKYQKTDINTY